LLYGVGAGILAKFIFHIINGAPIRSLFKARYEMSQNEDEYSIAIKDSAIFSNLIGFKNLFKKITPGKKVTLNFSEAKIVDHSFMEQLHHFEEEYQHNGGSVTVTGFEQFNFLSSHPLAARKLVQGSPSKIEIKLSPRQMELRKFSEESDFAFYPQRIRNLIKYKDFPIQRGNKILFEENVLAKYDESGKVEVADIFLQEGAMQDKTETKITILQFSETDHLIPDFALEPENLWSKLMEGVAGKDIDFGDHPVFSKKYYLRGENETSIRSFFSEPLIQFLENREEMHIECHRNRLVFYKKRDLLEPSEITYVAKFATEFVSLIHKKETQAV
jgi:hypothetical protein